MTPKTPNKADLLVYKALKAAIGQDKLRIYLDYGKVNRPQSPILIPVLIGLALIIGVGVIFGLLFIGVMIEVFSVYFKKKIYRRLIERTKNYLVSGYETVKSCGLGAELCWSMPTTRQSAALRPKGTGKILW